MADLEQRPDARWPFRIIAAVLGGFLLIPSTLSILDGEGVGHWDFLISGILILVLAFTGKWIG